MCACTVRPYLFSRTMLNGGWRAWLELRLRGNASIIISGELLRPFIVKNALRSVSDVPCSIPVVASHACSIMC